MALTEQEKINVISVYNRAYRVISLAERLLENEGTDVSQTSINRYWREAGLKSLPMSDVVKERIRYYAEQTRDPEQIRQDLVQEFSKIIPDYSMTLKNIRTQMKNVRIKPITKERGSGSNIRSFNGAARYLRKVGRKPKRGYEFCANA